jgi:hypothetical protein
LVLAAIGVQRRGKRNNTRAILPPITAAAAPTTRKIQRWLIKKDGASVNRNFNGDVRKFVSKHARQ